ncbi:MAG: hypothetical protein Q3M24_00320 [Candidatus Electrothrix aestuarii]|uniref:Uncharacterized protein n=1 Tax=Candidatus Electrothrix aestuarii TaxID=3062594 RepID=A0AAU8LWM9_9BACT
MTKNGLLLFVLLVLFFQVPAMAYAENVSKIIDWSKKKDWNLTSVPRDFAVSFDKKKIFILEEDNKVRVYANSYNGNRLGIIDVSPNTVAIDIAPRGGMLYLVGSDKTYSAIEIVYRKKDDSISDYSVKHTWKTEARPLDIAQSFDKKYAFVLENDSKVHVYTLAGVQQKVIPVSSDVVALTVPSRKRTLSFLGRNATFKSVQFSLR